jgi:hypothetical protein
LGHGVCGQTRREQLKTLAACRRERRNGRSGKEICLKSQKIAVKVV